VLAFSIADQRFKVIARKDRQIALTDTRPATASISFEPRERCFGNGERARR
jgi:hypothetical protein